MLRLTRRVGQSIVIGDEKNPIVITINGFLGNQIKLSITADKNIRIYREEVYRRIQAEKQIGMVHMTNENISVDQFFRHMLNNVDELELLTLVNPDFLL